MKNDKIWNTSTENKTIDRPLQIPRLLCIDIEDAENWQAQI